MIIVTGCERSGTTYIAKRIAKMYDLTYVHEGWADGSVLLKHSLNMNQNIKHLEFLQYKYNPRWFYVIRDGREVCRSMVQKVWKRLPHTMSLDDAIRQWNFVNKSCYGFGDAEVLRYEEFVDDPIEKWQDYFTGDQKEYLNEHLNLGKYYYI